MQKSRRFLALSLVTIILLVFGIAAYRNKNINTMTEAFAAEMTMEPTKYDSAGMDLDTGFVFSAQSPLNPRFIQENLVIEPDIDYTVKKNGQKVLVIPKEPLEPQKIYKFSIASKTQVPPKWAFQTKGDFQVVSTFPRDKSSGIPTNTGIEIVFSHLNFGQLEDFFTINPKVAGTFEVHKKTAVFVPKKLEPETIYTVTIKKGIPLEGSSQVLDEDLSFQFETSGESREDYSFNFYKPISEFPVDDKPVLQFNYYSWDSNTLAADLEFEIYKCKMHMNI